MDAATGIGRGLILDGQEIDVTDVVLATGTGTASKLTITMWVDKVDIEKVSTPFDYDERVTA